MLIVGLTGGIASGKSTVADFFRRSGARVIDADRIAHQVMAPQGSAWQAVVDAFGADVLAPDRRIDRKRLAEIVFAQPDRRRQLERIVHPHVRASIDAQVAHIQMQDIHALVVEDIPLLLEGGLRGDLAEIIVVYVPEAVQLLRLMKRDGLDRNSALLRIHAQLPMEEKKKRASIVIDNSGSLAATEEQFQRIYRRLAERARGG